MTAGGPGKRDSSTWDALLEMLDAVFEPEDAPGSRGSAAWWDGFYADRERAVPFFTTAPDESLVAWLADGRLALGPGARVLDLACGAGRNAVWLAQQGCAVDAVDISATALRWAAERADAAGVDVQLLQADIFDDEVRGREQYDLVVDSGCFHHLPPHRRLTYRGLLERLVRPDGALALTCFADEGGSQVPDSALYRLGSLAGGLAFSAEDLRRHFGWMQEQELRRMREQSDGAALFGRDFLWVGLFRRQASGA